MDTFVPMRLLLLLLLTSLSCGKLYRGKHVRRKHRHTHGVGTSLSTSHAPHDIVAASAHFHKKDFTGKTRHTISRFRNLDSDANNFFGSQQLQIKDKAWKVRHVIDSWLHQNTLKPTPEKLLRGNIVQKKDLRWKSRHVIGRWKVLNDSVLHKYMEKFSLDSKLAKLYGGLKDKVTHNFTLKSNGTHFNLGIAENNSSSTKNLLEIKDGYININSTLQKNWNKSSSGGNEDFLVMNEKNVTLHTSVGKWLKSIGLADRNSQLIWHIRKEDVATTEEKKFSSDSCQLKDCFSGKDTNLNLVANRSTSDTITDSATNDIDSKSNNTPVNSKDDGIKEVSQSNNLLSKLNTTESNANVASASSSIKSEHLNNTITPTSVVESTNVVTLNSNHTNNLTKEVAMKGEKGKKKPLHRKMNQKNEDIENEDPGSSDENNFEMNTYAKSCRNTSDDNIHSSKKDDESNINVDNGRFNVSSDIDVEVGPIDDSSVLKTYDRKTNSSSTFRMRENRPQKFAVAYTETNSLFKSYTDEEGSGSVNVKLTSKPEDEHLQKNVTNNKIKIIHLNEHPNLANSLMTVMANSSKEQAEESNMSIPGAIKHKNHSSEADTNAEENNKVKTEGEMRENQLNKTDYLNENKPFTTELDVKIHGNLVVKTEPNEGKKEILRETQVHKNSTLKTESNEHESRVAKTHATEHKNLMTKTEEEFEAGSTDENPDIPFDVSKFNSEPIDSTSSSNSSVLKAMIVEQLKSIEKTKDLAANENENHIANESSDLMDIDVTNKTNNFMDSASPTGKGKERTNTISADEGDRVKTTILKEYNEDQSTLISQPGHTKILNFASKTSKIDEENELNFPSQVNMEKQYTTKSQRRKENHMEREKTSKEEERTSSMSQLRNEGELMSQLRNEGELNSTPEDGKERKQSTFSQQENQTTSSLPQNNEEIKQESTTKSHHKKEEKSVSLSTDNERQSNVTSQTENGKEMNSTSQRGNEKQISSLLQNDDDKQLSFPKKVNRPSSTKTMPDNESFASQKQPSTTTQKDDENWLQSKSKSQDESISKSETKKGKEMSTGSDSHKERQSDASSASNIQEQVNGVLPTDNGAQTTSTPQSEERANITSTSSPTQKDERTQMSSSNNAEHLISQLKVTNNTSKQPQLHDEDATYTNEDDAAFDADSDESNNSIEKDLNTNTSEESNNSPTKSGDGMDVKVDLNGDIDGRGSSYTTDNNKVNVSNFSNRNKSISTPKKGSDDVFPMKPLNGEDNSHISKSSKQNSTSTDSTKGMTSMDKINKEANKDSSSLKYSKNLTKGNGVVKENMSQLKDPNPSNINSDLYYPTKLQHSHQGNENSEKRIFRFENTVEKVHFQDHDYEKDEFQDHDHGYEKDKFQDHDHDYGSGMSDYAESSAYAPSTNDMNVENVHVAPSNLIANTSTLRKKQANKEMLITNFREVGLGAKEDKLSSPHVSAGGKPPTSNEDEEESESVKVYPNLIDIALIDSTFCTMAKKLTVKYRSPNNTIETIDCGGNYNYSSLFDYPPDLTLDRANINGIYTLLMLDADAPSPFYPVARCVVHWMVVNIIEADVRRGTEVVPYKKLNPPTTTGPHRYVFLLLKQKEIEPFNSFRINDCNLDVNAFAARHNITYIEGFKYFTTQSKIDYLVLTQHHVL